MMQLRPLEILRWVLAPVLGYGAARFLIAAHGATPVPAALALAAGGAELAGAILFAIPIGRV